MGDGAEGLVDAEARIQDRLDELEQQRATQRRRVKDPELVRELESLRLARVEANRQAEATAHPVRREQLQKAMAELDQRITDVMGKLE